MKTRLTLIVNIAIALFIITSSDLWARPSGWLYVSWPYVHYVDRGDWHYIDDSVDQWACSMTTFAWGRFGKDILSPGWLYFQWPYAYNAGDGHWYYFDETDNPWAYAFSGSGSSGWYPFGELTDDDIYAFIKGVLTAQGQVAAAAEVDTGIPVGTIYYDISPTSAGEYYLVTDRDVQAGSSGSGAWLLGDGSGPSSHTVFYFYSGGGLRVYLGH